MGYDYSIMYKKRKENIVVDTLSRCPQTTGQLHMLSTVNFAFLEQVRASYVGDTKLQTLITQLQDNPLANALYMLKDGVLYRNGKIVVNPNKALKQ